MQKFVNRATRLLANTSVELYTPPENTDSTVHNILLTNSDPQNSALISLQLNKTDPNGNGAFSTGIFNLIPDGYELRKLCTLEMKPINLVFGDVLIIKSNASIDVVASILEETKDF